MELDLIDPLGRRRVLGGYRVARTSLSVSRASTRCPPTWSSSSRPLLREHRCGGDRTRGSRSSSGSSQERTVRPAEQELFKSRAREKGTVKVIDLVHRATRREDRLLPGDAPQPPAQGRSHRSLTWCTSNERMLTGGFYAEIDLEYDAGSPSEKNGRPVRHRRASSHPAVHAGRPATLARRPENGSPPSSGRTCCCAASASSRRPFRQRPRRLLLRMVPFVERNYNLVELGPAGTGKSHLFQQVSPYAHLVSGGKATVAKMFVNNATRPARTGRQYDVVCFDEVSGVSFDQKDGVNIMKGYMESGEFSRGKESIRADGGIVMVGNFDVDVDHQQRIGHLFGPFPEMRDDTAFMDRIHAYVPGWDVPKISRSCSGALRPG